MRSRENVLYILLKCKHFVALHRETNDIGAVVRFLRSKHPQEVLVIERGAKDSVGNSLLPDVLLNFTLAVKMLYRKMNKMTCKFGKVQTRNDIY